METLLGFKVTTWDYITFGVLFLCALIGLLFIVWVAGLPGRIAIARKHPDAEAVKVMGYAGLLPIAPWIQAFIWAFKPTDIIDIRRFPKAEEEAIDENIKELKGKPKKPKKSKAKKDVLPEEAVSKETPENPETPSA
jgi:hypothetical protein